MKRHPRIRRGPRAGDDPATQIAFAGAQPPPLQPGNSYTITATHAVAQSAGSPATIVPNPASGYQATLDLAVANNRFQLGAGDLLSVYPADGWTGNADNQLPFVVLTKPTLPWTFNAPDSGSQSPPCSRLGILVFQAPDAPPPQQMPLSSITPSDSTTCWPPGNGAISGSNYPALTQAETADQMVTVIDVPSTLFAEVAPMASDLPYIAHVRTLEDAGNNTIATYALVAGASLLPSGPCTAFLVSLDAYSDYLIPDSASGQLPVYPGNNKWSTYRLVVLTTWSFTNTDATLSFTDLALNLAAGALQWPQTGGTDATANNALQLGYVPMPHTLRDGSTTVSLYRGPLVPNPLPLDVSAAEAGNPGALMRYDPDQGVFDASYAAAWQLGQLLSASNARVLAAQNEITVAQMQAGNQSANRAVFAAHVPTLEQDEARTSQLLRRAMLRKVARFVVERGGKS